MYMFSLINNELEIICCPHLILSDCTGHHFMPEETRLLEYEYLEDLYLIEFLFFHFPSSVHLMLKSHSSVLLVSDCCMSGVSCPSSVYLATFLCHPNVCLSLFGVHLVFILCLYSFSLLSVSVSIWTLSNELIHVF